MENENEGEGSFLFLGKAEQELSFTQERLGSSHASEPLKRNGFLSYGKFHSKSKQKNPLAICSKRINALPFGAKGFRGLVLRHPIHPDYALMRRVPSADISVTRLSPVLKQVAIAELGAIKDGCMGWAM